MTVEIIYKAGNATGKMSTRVQHLFTFACHVIPHAYVLSADLDFFQDQLLQKNLSEIYVIRVSKILEPDQAWR